MKQRDQSVRVAKALILRVVRNNNDKIAQTTKNAILGARKTPHLLPVNVLPISLRKIYLQHILLHLFCF